MAYPKIFDSNNIELATLNNITSNSLKRRVNSFYEFNFQCYEEEFKSEYIQFTNYIQTDDETFDIAYIDVSNVNNSPYYDVKCEHVFYRLHDDATKKNNYALSGTPTEILTDLLSGTDFTVGTVDFTSNIVYAVNREATVMNIVISLANTLGAEIGFSNNGFTIDLLNTIGQDNGVEVRIKKNIKGISKSVDKRGVDKTSYKIDLVDVHNSEEYKDLTMIETLDIGDTFQLIDETLGINISQSVLEIEKDVIKESITNITTSNNFDLLDDKLSYIEETAVKKDEIIYGIKINEDVGLEIERDDKLARTKLNADEFRMQTGDGSGSYTDALYFDPINGKYIFVGEINASDFVGGTIEIGNNFEVDSNGNMTATNGKFSGDISASAITGGTIDIGSGTFMVDSQGNATASSLTILDTTVGTDLDISDNNVITSIASDISGNVSLIQQNSTEIGIVVGDVSGNTASIVVNSDAITSIVSDVSGNASSITQNASAITSIVSDVSGNASSITQNADNINLRVEKTDYDGNTIASLINQTATTIDISANKINLNGVVTMSGLANMNNDIYLGTGVDTFNQIVFNSFSSNKIRVVGAEMEFYSDLFQFFGNIVSSGLLTGAIRCDDIGCGDIGCDDIDCDDISCDGLTRNNNLTTYGVKTATDTIDFYTSAGTHIGGINFASGAIWN